MACILGRSQAPLSNLHFKQLTREVNAVLPWVKAAKPFKWSQFHIVFDSGAPQSPREP